jgi:hypothetical protein
MAYQPNVPTGTVPLNQDYANLQGNFSSLDSQWKVDHVPLTNTSGVPPAGDNGYHTFVHFVPFSTPSSVPPSTQPVVPGVSGPSATPGFGQLFGVTVADGQNTDSSLYYLSSGGRLTQLTRNIQPLAASPGYTFLPGGLIFQWGVTVSSGTGNISFPIPFTAGTFLPVVTIAPVSGPAVTLLVSTSDSGFKINQNGIGVSWMAIGQ